MFHYREGFYAARNADGSVTLSKHSDAACQCAMPRFKFNIDPFGWASIVASVSVAGETGESYRAAERLHMGAREPEPQATVAVPDGADTGKDFAKLQTACDQFVDLLRSARAIAERKGEGTNWELFSKRIAQFGIGSVTPRTFRYTAKTAEEADAIEKTKLEVIKEQKRCICYKLHMWTPRENGEVVHTNTLEEAVEALKKRGHTYANHTLELISEPEDEKATP